MTQPFRIIRLGQARALTQGVGTLVPEDVGIMRFDP